MKYPPLANIVNLLFLGVFVTIPVIYCLKNASLSIDTVRLILFATFILGIVIFADWYHIYFTNTYKSIFWAFIAGISLFIICVLATSFFGNKTIIELITFREKAWQDSRFFLRFFVAGIGISTSAIYSIPRLFLIRLITDEGLPEIDLND